MADSLWDSIIGGINDLNNTAKDINSTYQEIKNGSTNSTSAEQAAQLNAGVRNVNAWLQPGVIVAVVGIIIALFLGFRK
jgi:uncharacterized phage infection (PIP) family protein YhgE